MVLSSVILIIAQCFSYDHPEGLGASSPHLPSVTHTQAHTLGPRFDRMSGTITTRQLMHDPWVWPADPRTHCYSLFTLYKLTNVFMRPFNRLPMSFWHPCFFSHFLTSSAASSSFLPCYSKDCMKGPQMKIRKKCRQRKEHIYILAVFLDIRGASRCKYESDSSHNERIETHYEISGSDQWRETLH